MDRGDLFIISIVLIVIAIVWISHFYSSRKQAAFQRTVQEAIKAGQPLSVEALKTLAAPDQERRDPLVGLGVALSSVGLALIVFAFAIMPIIAGIADVPQHAISLVAGIGLVLGSAGLIIVVHAVLRRPRDG